MVASKKRKVVHAVEEAEPSTSSSSQSRGVANPSGVDVGNAGLPTPAPDPPAPDDEEEIEDAPDYAAVARKRYDKTGKSVFFVGNRYCFKGGYLGKECILPTICFGEMQMMKVGGREDWIVSSATGKVERRGSFEKGVLRCKKDIIAAIAIAASAARGGKVQAAAAGRNLLDIPSDSDSSSTSGDEDEGKQQETVDDPLDLEGVVYLVDYRGLKFNAVNTGRLLYVEARADVARRIVTACLTASVAVIKEDTRPEVEGPAPAPLADTSPAQGEVLAGSIEPNQSRVANPKGKSIRFDVRRSCYEISYVEEQGGHVHRCVKGLRVATKDKNKVPLAPLLVEVNMARTFEKGKNLWNTMDMSDLPRFPS